MKKALLVTFLCISPWLQSADVPESKPQLDLKYDKGTQTAWLVNQEPVPYTFRIHYTQLDNARTDCPDPCIVAVPPFKTVRAFTVRPKSRTQAWRFRYTYRTQMGDYRSTHDDDHAYRLPTSGQTSISQGYFGTFSHQDKYALDFKAPLGTPILATRGGIVGEVVSHFKEGGIKPEFKNKANRVTIVHSDGSLGFYAHFKHQGVSVKVGDTVTAGDVIGYAGSTGYSSRPHLHFEVQLNKYGEKRVSIPVQFLTSQGRQSLKTERSYHSP